MGRTVGAMVTWGDAYLGTIGPVGVSIPWRSEVEPVVAHLREVLDVPVIVLRLTAQIRALLDGPVASELSAGETAAARGLLSRFPLLGECGLPDTLVHGDFHPGNWRSDGGPPAIVDWADAHLGNPVLDGLRACDYLPPAKRPAAVRAWIAAWSSRVPECDPARALRIAEPLSHLACAVRYQEFLDGIEPAERIYHRGDPAAAIRAALRSAPDG